MISLSAVTLWVGVEVYESVGQFSSSCHTTSVVLRYPQGGSVLRNKSTTVNMLRWEAALVFFMSVLQ